VVTIEWMAFSSNFLKSAEVHFSCKIDHSFDESVFVNRRRRFEN
jgi:hypothetical protein